MPISMHRRNSTYTIVNSTALLTTTPVFSACPGAAAIPRRPRAAPGLLSLCLVAAGPPGRGGLRCTRRVFPVGRRRNLFAARACGNGAARGRAHPLSAAPAPLGVVVIMVRVHVSRIAIGTPPVVPLLGLGRADSAGR